MIVIKTILICALVTFTITASFAAEPRRVGVIAPLSGPLSDIGETVKNCVEFVSKQYGDTSAIKFIFEDDGFNTRNTVAALHKLMSQDQIDYLIVFGSSTSLAVADTAERRKIPFISMGMSDEITKGRSFVFRHFSTAAEQHQVILKEVLEREYKTIAIVALAQDAMLSMRQLMLKDAESKIVVDEEILPGDSDLRAVALKIKASNPDAVYLLLLPPHLSVLSRNLRELGYQGQFFGAAPMQHAGEVQAALGALDGAWLGTTDDSQDKNFKARYFERFQSFPHPDGVHACDVAKIIIENANKPDLVKALREAKGFSGIYGNYTLRGDDNTFVLPVTIKTVRGQQFERN